MDHSFEELQKGRQCDLCRDAQGGECYDWPFSDVPGCREYDTMRNCIYAAHGYVFTQQEWKDYFSRVSWYRPDPTFTPDRLSKTAIANVELLKKLAKDKTRCLDAGGR